MNYQILVSVLSAEADNCLLFRSCEVVLTAIFPFKIIQSRKLSQLVYFESQRKLPLFIYFSFYSHKG